MRGLCKGKFFIFFMLSVCVIAFIQKKAYTEDGDSSACISCHTDLEEMDDYGAKAASAAAAVAG